MGYCTWAGMNEANQIYHDTEWCSGRVKRATPGSDRKGQFGSGNKGQSEEKGHYYGSYFLYNDGC